MSSGISGCIHYWLLDRFNHGECKRCGKVQDFPDAIDYRRIGIERHVPRADYARTMEDWLERMRQARSA